MGSTGQEEGSRNLGMSILRVIEPDKAHNQGETSLSSASPWCLNSVLSCGPLTAESHSAVPTTSHPHRITCATSHILISIIYRLRKRLHMVRVLPRPLKYYYDYVAEGNFLDLSKKESSRLGFTHCSQEKLTFTLVDLRGDRAAAVQAFAGRL